LDLFAIINEPLEEIILDSDQDFFTIEFAALDYTNPEKNQYAYMLEGVDRDWVPTDASRRLATYTKLDPGEYLFRVKGSNNDAIWNKEGIAVKITILPPWWRTNWAYASYILIFVFILYALRSYDLRRQRLKHELQLEQVEIEKLKEIDHVKSSFFANISHEFRTPLTLIKVPLQRLRQEQGPDPDPRLETMLRNTNRLEQLIDQLLDLSRLEAGRLPVRWQRGDCMSLLRVYVAGFENVAAQRGIELVIRASTHSCVAWHDGDLVAGSVDAVLAGDVPGILSGG